MNLTDLINSVRLHSGQSSDEVIRAAIQLAAEEVWNTVDLPNTLREARVETNSERYVALPWEIYKIRKARMSNARLDLELNTAGGPYQDDNFYQSDLTCRILRRVPLHTKITNASTIRFQLKKAQTADVQLTVCGETDLASRCIEPVTIPAGATYQDTVERYVNIPEYITKAAATTVDIQIRDASGNEIGLFPAHLTECTYYLAQFYDRCTQISSPYLGCVDIVYKPHMPPLTDSNDVFPAPFHQVVIFKALEHIYLKSDETVETAAVYNQKALEILRQFTTDELLGRTLKPALKRNGFISPISFRL